MDNSIERRLSELREIAAKYAKAKREAVYLEDFKKSKLAIIMKKYEPEHKTAAAQEREARADDEYIKLLSALADAVGESELCRWNLEIAKMGAGLWQTQQATKREELREYRK